MRPADVTEPAPVYTPQQVAEHLQVSVVWVMRALKAGRLTGFRVGRLWRISAQDLQAFIDAHRAHGLGKGDQ
jgi:excisionase family DNA binding protein